MKVDDRQAEKDLDAVYNRPSTSNADPTSFTASGADSANDSSSGEFPSTSKTSAMRSGMGLNMAGKRSSLFPKPSTNYMTQETGLTVRHTWPRNTTGTRDTFRSMPPDMPTRFNTNYGNDADDSDTNMMPEAQHYIPVKNTVSKKNPSDWPFILMLIALVFILALVVLEQDFDWPIVENAGTFISKLFPFKWPFNWW